MSGFIYAHGSTENHLRQGEKCEKLNFFANNRKIIRIKKSWDFEGFCCGTQKAPVGEKQQEDIADIDRTPLLFCKNIGTIVP